MSSPLTFLDTPRQDVPHRPIDQRLRDFREVDLSLDEQSIVRQASRCMDCGIPFCHGIGCPLGNRVPEFNSLLSRGRWKEACENLHSTNNFPEFTGRICPALCEAACTLNINDQPTLIRHIEYQIVERAWREGWIVPQPSARRTGKSVAVVGSGPAALAGAQQLARAGHAVTIFEKDESIGGLLRFGIPDFKLDKSIIDRRLDQMRAEGVEFQTSVLVGDDVSFKYLRKSFDAVLLAIGCGQPRELDVPGRSLDNVLMALDYLGASNRVVAGSATRKPAVSAEGLSVAVIGGGDTGSDCVGTARRQGAREVYQLEILPEPPQNSNPQTPWPSYPRILRTSTSHEEGCTRRWNVMTRRLVGKTRVQELHGVEVEWSQVDGRPSMREIPGSDFVLKVDLVLIAMGFVHPQHTGIVEQAEIALDARGNIQTDASFMTSQPGIFAAGDARRGASLVVHGIVDGRAAAAAIDAWLNS